jgi:hypothetical protein
VYIYNVPSCHEEDSTTTAATYRKDYAIIITFTVLLAITSPRPILSLSLPNIHQEVTSRQAFHPIQ